MKIGFICLPLSGHLNPMIALARAVQEKGHTAVFFGVVDSHARVRAAGLTFFPLCEAEYPKGSVAEIWAPVRKLHGPAAMQYWAEEIHPAFLQHTLRELPPALMSAKVDAVVVDTAFGYVELAAIRLGLPYVHVWLVLNLDATGTTPPNLFAWPHEDGLKARTRNLEGVQRVSKDFLAPSASVARAFAGDFAVSLDLSDPASTVSNLAVISQTPKTFDYPDIPWFPQFHYTAPFTYHNGQERMEFDWDWLGDQPLIYASVGTVVNGSTKLHRAILAAVARLTEYCVVFSVGAEVDLEELRPIPENTLVVREAPQLQLLQRAALCITHGGLNTVLEALSAGVPLAAIPMAFDHPGIAARIAYHRVGEFIEFENLSGEALYRMISTVLDEPSYLQNAKRFQAALSTLNGPALAADCIDQVLTMDAERSQGTEQPESSSR